MIDSVILHMGLNYRESKLLKPQFPVKYYKYAREQCFYNSNVKLSLFVRGDYHYLRLHVKSVNDLLEQSKVTNKDYDLFTFMLNKILVPFNLNLITFQLREIHYKLDINCTEQEKHEYLNAITKCKSSHYNIERVLYYNDLTGKLETIKFKPVPKIKKVVEPPEEIIINPKIKEKSKDVSHEITAYCKDSEVQKHPWKAREYLVDILRIEIKIKKKKLDSYSKKYGIEKTLHNYFNSDMRELFFNDLFFKPFVGKGDYYSIDESKKLFKGDKLKSKCIKLFENIAKDNYDKAILQSTLPTVNKYISIINQKGINYVPIIGMDRLEGIPSILRMDTLQLSATPL